MKFEVRNAKCEAGPKPELQTMSFLVSRFVLLISAFALHPSPFLP
jgi:hypothetical protein